MAKNNSLYKPLKALWFSPVLLPDMLHYLGQAATVRAGWIASLLSALRKFEPEINFIIVAVADVKDEIQFKTDNITYVLLPNKNQSLTQKSNLLITASNIVYNMSPDIIHVHGTESLFALLACNKDLKIPVVVSIQGLLSRCLPYQTACLSFREKFIWQFSPRNILTRQGPFFTWWAWRKQIPAEIQVLRKGHYFIGRTDWDKFNVQTLNPNACYFHGDEVLRPVFYTYPTRTATNTTLVLLVSRATPLKGITIFFDALAILRKWGIHCKSRIFGRFNSNDGLGAILLKRIHNLNLDGCVELIGLQSDENVAKEMAEATIYVHPSFIDNSPNSVCEAMLIGTPVVSSNCGGIPSLINHNETGILVPPGNPKILAEEIMKLLENPEKARALADRAKQVALIRHDSKRIANRQVFIYHEIIKDFKIKKGFVYDK